MKSIIVTSIVLTLVLAGVARADVMQGTALFYISSDRSIYLDMKGVALYKFFIGDHAHNQVSGTDYLSFDAGKNAPRFFGGAVENKVDANPEDFGALDFNSMLSTAPANYDLITGEFMSWDASQPKDTYVNVTPAFWTTGRVLWLEYQTLGSSPVMFSGWIPEPATLCLLAIGGAAMLRRRGTRK